MEDTNVHDAVKDYYGKQLKSVDDLKTQACVIAGRKVTKPVREAVAAVHEEVASRWLHYKNYCEKTPRKHTPFWAN